MPELKACFPPSTKGLDYPLGHRSDRFSYGYLLGIMALPAQHRILPLRGGVAQTEYVQGNVGHLEACVIGYYLNSCLLYTSDAADE